MCDSEDSDQPAHPRSLIRVFADRMCLLKPPIYPKRDKREPLPYWVDVQADLSLCWSHRSYCRFCRALAQLYFHTDTNEYLLKDESLEIDKFIHKKRISVYLKFSLVI